MKKLISAVIAALMLSLCLCAPTSAADPVPTKVTKWDYTENFDEMPTGAVFTKANKACAAGDIGTTVENGNLVIKNSEAVEYAVKLTGEKLVKCDDYIIEVKYKLTASSAANTAFQVFGYLSNGFRIHSQIGSDSLRLRKTDGKFEEIKGVTPHDGKYHTVRYEVRGGEGKATGSMFLDGKHMITCDLQGNNVKDAFVHLIVKANKAGEEGVLSVDYVKAKKLVPEQHIVPEWSFEETFNGTTDALTGWNLPDEDGRSAVISDGILTIKNSKKGELVINIQNDNIAKCGSFALEMKARATFTPTSGSRVSLISFMGEGFRIHSQIKEGIVSCQNKSEWASGKFANNDGSFHLYRYEVTIADGKAVCNVFVDGEYLFSSEMNPNNGNSIHKLVLNTPVDGEEAKLEIDYIRSAAVDFSGLKTGAQPEPGNVTPPDPDPEPEIPDVPKTGSALPAVSVMSAVAAGVAFGVNVKKKKR